MIWEYIRIFNANHKALEELNALGADRWELCGISKDYFYFKRPLLR